MGKCIAPINCTTGEECGKPAKHATKDSGGIWVYCDKHFKNLQNGMKFCVPKSPTNLRTALLASSPRSAVSPRLSAVSPVNSVRSPLSSAVSPRSMVYESEQEEYESESDYESDSDSGFVPESPIWRNVKRQVRPKKIYERTKKAPEFKIEDGAAQQLIKIDTTDDVKEALINLSLFKGEVFGAKTNVDGDENVYQSFNITEKAINQTAKILGQYMNNPMRIELVLSFLFDYDTRDLSVPFSYFGFRKPKNNDLLNTTLYEYIKMMKKGGNPWTYYPTEDVRIDYKEDLSQREQLVESYKEEIATWDLEKYRGETAFQGLFKDTQETVEKFEKGINIQPKTFQDKIWKLIRKKAEIDEYKKYRPQQNQGQQAQTQPVFAGAASARTPASGGIAPASPVPPGVNLPGSGPYAKFEEVIDFYGPSNKSRITNEEIENLNKLAPESKTKILTSVNTVAKSFNDNKDSSNKNIGPLLKRLAGNLNEVNGVIAAINKLAKVSGQSTAPANAPAQTQGQQQQRSFSPKKKFNKNRK